MWTPARAKVTLLYSPASGVPAAPPPLALRARLEADRSVPAGAWHLGGGVGAVIHMVAGPMETSPMRTGASCEPALPQPLC